MNQKYLNPNIINTLENLQLKAQFIVEGFMTGLHKSPFHGFSVEFSEHRSYTPGDETKNIDWKLWSKTDKYYIKRFEEETNLLCHIFLDSSQSMSFSSNNVTKFEYAQMLAAALSYLIIKQRDSLGLHVFDSKIRQTIRPKSTKNHLNTILSVMDKIKIGHKTNISEILHAGAEKIKKRGFIILLSDLFDSSQKIINSLKHLRYYNHEVLVFHILDKQEIELNYNEKMIFEDLENDNQIVTEPWQIKKSYKKEMKERIEYFNTECSGMNISYNLILTDQLLDLALYKFLNKRKKNL
tara:strand:+ start:59 stop:946 length:888 start_codon:yes stop_codon:yes gene_type:complete